MSCLLCEVLDHLLNVMTSLGIGVDYGGKHFVIAQIRISLERNFMSARSWRSLQSSMAYTYLHSTALTFQKSATSSLQRVGEGILYVEGSLLGK